MDSLSYILKTRMPEHLDTFKRHSLPLEWSRLTQKRLLYHPDTRAIWNQLRYYGLPMYAAQAAHAAKAALMPLSSHKHTPAIYEGLNFDLMDLSRTVWGTLELPACSFVGADLSHSNFSRANLTNTDFTYAKATNAKFSRTLDLRHISYLRSRTPAINKRPTMYHDRARDGSATLWPLEDFQRAPDAPPPKPLPPSPKAPASRSVLCLCTLHHWHARAFLARRALRTWKWKYQHEWVIHFPTGFTPETRQAVRILRAYGYIPHLLAVELHSAGWEAGVFSSFLPMPVSGTEWETVRVVERRL